MRQHIVLLGSIYWASHCWKHCRKVGKELSKRVTIVRIRTSLISSSRHGWRSFFWLSLGLTAFNLILLIFLFPETKHHRDLPRRSTPQSTTEDVADEKSVIASLEHDEEPSNLLAQERAVPSVVGRGAPARYQFKLIQRLDPQWKSFLARDIFSPLHVFLFPIIV